MSLVLPDLFAEDPERLARFEREAKTLAALSHPNIATIYGVEEQNRSTGSAQTPARALVMELVEGENSRSESPTRRFRSTKRYRLPSTSLKRSRPRRSTGSSTAT